MPGNGPGDQLPAGKILKERVREVQQHWKERQTLDFKRQHQRGKSDIKKTATKPHLLLTSQQ